MSLWGKVAAEQLKPVISGDLMKKVRYRRVSNTAAFSLPPRSHYRRVLTTAAFSLPSRSHYRRVLFTAAFSLPPRSQYHRVCCVQMKADRKKNGKSKAVKSEGEAAGKVLSDEELTSQHAIADDLDALPSDRRKRGRHNVRYPPRF